VLKVYINIHLPRFICIWLTIRKLLYIKCDYLEILAHLIFSYPIKFLICFNKKQYQLDTTMMSLQCYFSDNVSQTVIKTVY